MRHTKIGVMCASAAVVGSGPNGLSAAVTLARAGLEVAVFESAETAGGGTRTAELVQSGVLHDVCSAIHPMALTSGFFRAFNLTSRVDFTVPDISYANPLDGPGSGVQAALAHLSLDRTVAGLGKDGPAYRRLFAPLIRQLEELMETTLGGSMLRLPKHPITALLLGARVAEQGTPLWNLRFRAEPARALLTGVSAHSIGRLPSLATSAVGLVLGTLAHTTGWPVPIGGSRAIAEAMLVDLMAHGGTVQTGHRVSDLRELNQFDLVLFDTAPKTLAAVAGRALPERYRRSLNTFRYGNAATKVDFVLDGPIPWADEQVALTATVHLCGSRAELARSEAQVAQGEHPQRPFVLLTQPTAFDPSRNPEGVHTISSYTHVPSGSTVDLREAVIRQIERFAPGFRDRIVATHQTTAAELSRYNENYVGGDFSAGAIDIWQLIARPRLSRTPWRTPKRGLYLASSSTSPGPGVHGLSGWYAARTALTDFGIEPTL